MKTLFIDTHLNDIIVMLLENGKLVDKREVINKKNNSEVLFPTIIDVINDNKLDEVVVVNGPGSFTGVRLGVTIAKTLAYSLNIPIKTITALEVMVISNNTYNVALSDSNGYYVGKFNETFNPVEEYYYVNNSEFINKEMYETNYKIDIEKVYQHLTNIDAINAHKVNPIYIKKIGVEIDKKSN